MLSSLGHKVDELVQTVEGHRHRVASLETSNKSLTHLQSTLSTLNAEVESLSFSVNEIQATVAKHNEDIQELRAKSSSFEVPLTGGPLDLAIEGYHLSPRPLTPMSLPGYHSPLNNTPRSCYSDVEDGRMFSPLPPEFVNKGAPDDSVYLQNFDDVNDPNVLKQHIAECQAHIQQQRSLIVSKDNIIRDLCLKQDRSAKREHDYIQKQDWYEHKMRLLKQDKRRRGEAVGRLVKSVDDLRGRGRIRFSEQQLRDGYGHVISCALLTHGCNIEDRVRAVINAAEMERVMQRSNVEGEGAAELDPADTESPREKEDLADLAEEIKLVMKQNTKDKHVLH